jgi:transposase
MRVFCQGQVTVPVGLLLLLFFRAAVSYWLNTAARYFAMQRSINMGTKRTISDQEAKRHAALAALKAHKLDVKRAAIALKNKPRFMKAQLDKYKQRGSVSALPRSGRPKLLNAAQVEAAVELVLQHQSVAAATAVLKEQGTIASSISTKTVNMAVKSALKLTPCSNQRWRRKWVRKGTKRVASKPKQGQ